MRYRIGLGVAGALLAALALCGCNDPAGNDKVSQQWQRALKPFGLVPLYPPREDVMPGDVFLLNQDITEASQPVDIWPVRVGQIELPRLMRLLRREQAGRAVLVRQAAATPDAARPDTAKPDAPRPEAAKPEAPRSDAPTPKAPTPEVAANTGAEPVYALRAPAPGEAAPVLLRRLVLPSLVMAHVTAADLAGGGLVGNVGVSGGFGFNRNGAVSMTLSRLYELHVSAATALAAARDNVGRLILHSLRPSIVVDLLGQRDPSLAQALCAADWPRLDRDGHTLLVANQVIYAGAIDYSFDDSTSIAGVASAQIGPNLGPAPNGGSGSTAPAGNDAAARLASLLTTLNEHAAKYSAASAGVQASFGIGRTGHLKLTLRLDPPQAVGFAGSARYSIHDLFDVLRVERGLLAHVFEVSLEREMLGVRCQEYGVPDGAARLVAYLQPGPGFYRPTPQRRRSLGIR